jgi:hypothetical protein
MYGFELQAFALMNGHYSNGIQGFCFWRRNTKLAVITYPQSAAQTCDKASKCLVATASVRYT